MKAVERRVAGPTGDPYLSRKCRCLPARPIAEPNAAAPGIQGYLSREPNLRFVLSDGPTHENCLYTRAGDI